MEFEVMIRNSIVKCKGDASTMFAILKSLKENNKEPKFRIWDEELNDLTCWQDVLWISLDC